MRNIVNSLAGSKVPLGVVSIGLYEKEFEGKAYANVWVKNNGERTEWMFTPEQQKTMKKVITDPDTNEVIKTKRDDMENKLKELYPNINKNKETKETKPVVDTSDDLPF